MHEPTYPIFFQMHQGIETGFRSEWFWQDLDLGPEDIGGYRSRAEAVADWAADRLMAEMRRELESLDQILALPMLQQAGRRPAAVDLRPVFRLAEAIGLVEELATTVPLPVQLRLPLEAA